ncbi:testicular haploid expressed gene protein-like [Psammomys obesus]|uniref:testicular haploid expressed gene protein-like n=1 Tax=Psammomys obesus TaxID=48139 RepID=UPI002453606D|nr:testicular haploid expressed gene protein-like [Psammomys obesus]
MEERSSSLGSCELTDERNTATNSDDCQKPLLLTFLDVENEPEGGELGIEEEGQEDDGGYEVPQIQEAPEPSPPFKFLEYSESVLFRKDSESFQPPRASQPVQPPPVRRDEKEDLPPNAVLTTSPSLLAGYFPRLRLGSLSGRSPLPPAEIHPSRT